MVMIDLDLTNKESLEKACYKNRLDIGSVKLPPVDTIPMDSFFNNLNLKDLYIPNGIKILGNWCFGNCISLKKIEIPQSTEYIGIGAFRNCSKLSEVKFTGIKINRIEKTAFAECSSLQNIVIPDGVETIDERVFMNCIELKSVSLPSSIKYIGESVFKNCIHLTDVLIRGKNPTKLIIDKTAFWNCINIKNNQIITSSSPINVRIIK